MFARLGSAEHDAQRHVERSEGLFQGRRSTESSLYRQDFRRPMHAFRMSGQCEASRNARQMFGEEDVLRAPWPPRGSGSCP